MHRVSAGIIWYIYDLAFSSKSLPVPGSGVGWCHQDFHASIDYSLSPRWPCSWLDAVLIFLPANSLGWKDHFFSGNPLKSPWIYSQLATWMRCSPFSWWPWEQELPHILARVTLLSLEGLGPAISRTRGQRIMPWSSQRKDANKAKKQHPRYETSSPSQGWAHSILGQFPGWVNESWMWSRNQGHPSNNNDLLLMSLDSRIQ